MSEMLLALLNEKQERQAYQEKVLTALRKNYQIVPIEDVVARQCTTAGHVYSYLSLELGEVNSHQYFQRKIKAMLIELGIVKPTQHGGLLWFKGLIAKDPTEDLAKADKVIQQHYQDRKTYRERQRKNAEKRIREKL